MILGIKILIWVVTYIIARYGIKKYRVICQENVDTVCTYKGQQDWAFQLKIAKILDTWLPVIFVILIVIALA